MTFIIIVICLNFLIKIFKLLFLNYILAKIKIKILQESKKFNVIYIIINIISQIITT